MAGMVLQSRVQALAKSKVEIYSSDLNFTLRLRRMAKRASKLSIHRKPDRGNNEKLSYCAMISTAQGFCTLWAI